MATPQTDNFFRMEDFAKLTTNQVTMGLVAALYDTQSILKDVPFKPGTDFSAKGLRITPGGLPAVGYGSLNETPNSVRATTEQHEDKAFLIRENVKMDRRYRDMKNLIVNPIETQTMALFEAWARQLNTDFISNDPATGSKGGPDGLKTRLLNVTKYGHVAECMIDAGGLDISSAATQAKANKFFSYIDQMLMYMNAPDGTGVVLYMNDFMFRAFVFLARLLNNGAGLKTTVDNYDREITTYKNARLRDVGRKSDDSTRIITNTESADGLLDTTGAKTSIYGVRYGGSYVTGWHDGKMDLSYVGTDPTGTQDIWLLDYLFGMYHGHSRTVTRLFDLVAPVS